MTLSVSNIKPNLAFDVFTVENSRFQENGALDPGFRNFGLGWYQSDLEVNALGKGSVKIQTILLDQIFGLDQEIPAIDATSPATTHHTFHVGFWFNNPADVVACGISGHTPFNGEQHAGPLAMMSRPEEETGLGPLCTNPDGHGGCNP